MLFFILIKGGEVKLVDAEFDETEILFAYDELDELVDDVGEMDLLNSFLFNIEWFMRIFLFVFILLLDDDDDDVSILLASKE